MLPFHCGCNYVKISTGYWYVHAYLCSSKSYTSVLPPRQSCSNRVSLESRSGIYFTPEVVSAVTTRKRSGNSDNTPFFLVYMLIFTTTPLQLTAFLLGKLRPCTLQSKIQCNKHFLEVYKGLNNNILMSLL